MLNHLVHVQVLLDEAIEVLQGHRRSGVHMRVDLRTAVEVALPSVLALPLLEVAVGQHVRFETDAEELQALVAVGAPAIT